MNEESLAALTNLINSKHDKISRDYFMLWWLTGLTEKPEKKEQILTKTEEVQEEF